MITMHIDNQKKSLTLGIARGLCGYGQAPLLSSCLVQSKSSA